MNARAIPPIHSVVPSPPPSLAPSAIARSFPSGYFPLLLISVSVLIRLIPKTIACSAEMNLSKHAALSLLNAAAIGVGHWRGRISFGIFRIVGPLIMVYTARGDLYCLR